MKAVVASSARRRGGNDSLSAPDSIVTRVEIIGAAITDFLVGETAQRTARVLDQFDIPVSGEAVTWASDDELVFTVDPDTGEVTAVGAGTAILTASSGAATPDTIAVTVTARLGTTLVLVPGGSVLLAPTETVQITATIFDQHEEEIVGATVAFESDDEEVATVDVDGLATAVADGQATITVTSDNAVGTTDVTVLAPPPVPNTLWQDADLLLGGDGTGSVIGAVYDSAEAIADANGAIVSWDTALGASEPLTIVGAPVRTAAGTVAFNTTTDKAYSAISSRFNPGRGGTLCMVARLQPTGANTTAVSLSRDTGDGSQEAMLRATMSATAGNITSAQSIVGGGAAVCTSAVPLSGTPRFIAVKRTDNTFAHTLWVAGDTPVTQSGAVATEMTDAAYRLIINSISLNSPSFGGAEIDFVLWVPDVALTQAQLDELAELVEADHPFEYFVPAPSPVVNSVVASPNTLLLTTGNTFQVTASALDINGTALQGEGFTYSSGNQAVATVSSTGVITPVGAGSATITVRSASVPSKTDTVAVTIAAPLASSLLLSPPSANIGVGGTVAFTASVKDQAEADSVSIGFPMAASVSFSSGTPAVATINSSTGVATGVSQGGPVVITAQSGAVSDTSSLNVIAPGADFPNEPVGFVQLNDRPFLTTHPPHGFGGNPPFPAPADLHLAEGWTSIEGKHPNISAVDATGNPEGDGRIGQQRYPALMRSGVGPGTATYQVPPGVNEVYISIWAMLSPNWIANQSNTNKMCFFGVCGGNNQFILSAQGRECGRLAPRLQFQGIQEIDFRSDFDPSFQFQNREMKRGVWTQIEMRVKMHSQAQVGQPGQPGFIAASGDGEVDLWVDGLPQLTMRNMHLAQKVDPTRTPLFNMINWNPTFGGGGSGIPRNFVDANDANGVFTVCRQYIFDQSQLPLGQRGTLSGKEQSYPAPSPFFEIDPADEAQYLWFDRVYISHNP